ncbi:MAG TPA: LLM class flavin-dependent oxidoreductase, partial [Pseudonocardiaceae bacterium]
LAGDLSAERIAWYRDTLTAGAEAAGRELPAGFPVWGLLRTCVDADPEYALDRAAPALAAAANHAYRGGFDHTGLDADTQDRIGALRADYRVAAHNDFAADRDGVNPNGALVRRLGLGGPLADRFGLVGDVGRCAERLRALESAGLDHLVIRPVTTEPLNFLARWADVLDEFGR